jgi:hypothetical protein
MRKRLMALIQMRIRKIATAAYLCRIGARDSPQYTCRRGIQIVRHIIMDCEDLIPLRNQIWGGHKKVPHDYIECLTDPKLVGKTADLIIDAGFTLDLVLTSNNSEGGVRRHYHGFRKTVLPIL